MVETRKPIKFQLANGNPVKASAELLSANLAEIKNKYAWGGKYQFSLDNAPVDIESEAFFSLEDVIVLGGQTRIVTLLENP